ncbi:MAG: helix-turn-helix transcriptional regulator [Actinobacteria bacterium]|nr:helix-turn-helix transcriptional regulator [Actinomycetota bacterium]
MTTSGMGARYELAELIKEARRAFAADGRRLSQEKLGTRLGWSQGKIQKIEAGSVKIEPKDVDKIIDTLAISPAQAQRMRDLVALSAVGEPWSGERALVPPYAHTYMELEQNAAEILSWHEGRIPGPLQSTQFMLKQFETAGKRDVAPYMRNREHRKKLFHQAQLKRYHCVLGEEALRRAASGLGRSIALDQIDYLLEINDPHNPRKHADQRTCVSLLPIEAAVPYLPTDFSILRLPDSETTYVYIEHVGGARCLKTDEVVEQAWQDWQHISSAALDREATEKLLRKLRIEFASR